MGAAKRLAQASPCIHALGEPIPAGGLTAVSRAREESETEENDRDCPLRRNMEHMRSLHMPAVQLVTKKRGTHGHGGHSSSEDDDEDLLLGNPRSKISIASCMRSGGAKVREAILESLSSLPPDSLAQHVPTV